MRSTTRRRRAVLIALVVAAVLRGWYWAGITELWHRDEAQHAAYVMSLASGNGIPVIGREFVPADVLELSKASPNGGTSANGLPPDPMDERWGTLREQYEAGQGPIYYAVLAPLAAVLDEFALQERVLLLRALTTLLLVSALPLVWMLTRLLLPRVFLAAPLSAAVLAAWQAFATAGATLNNDALIMPLTMVSLVAAAASFARGPSIGRTALAALALAVALLTKATAATVVPRSS